MITPDNLPIHDYSHWLTPGRLAVEEANWAKSRPFDQYVPWVLGPCQTYGLKTILDLGCATGWLPLVLPSSLHYTGVDANPDCIAAARRKNPTREFILQDIRTLDLHPVDLVCCFATLKHFSIEEWPEIIRRVLQHGAYGLLSVPLSTESRQRICEGTHDEQDPGYVHCWLTRDFVEQGIRQAGHEIISAVDDPCEETIFLTRRAS